MINAHLYAADGIKAIESALEPNEVAIALCDFTVVNEDVARTVILTNRHIRFTAYKRNWWTGNGLQLVGNSAVALRAISGIATFKGSQGLLGTTEILQLTFWWDGRQENLVTTTILEGNLFVEKLREVVASKEMPEAGNAPPKNTDERLKSLKDLYDRGIISEAEYNAKRQKILDEL